MWWLVLEIITLWLSFSLPFKILYLLPVLFNGFFNGLDIYYSLNTFAYSPHGILALTASFPWNVLLRQPNGLLLHDLVFYDHVTLTVRKLSQLLHFSSQHFFFLPFPSFFLLAIITIWNSTHVSIFLGGGLIFTHSHNRQ